MAAYDSLVVMTRITTTLTEVMTPEQCREAAEKLRALEGDEKELKLFAGVADSLDTYAEMREAESAESGMSS
jgi:hypothetical protein